jgi:hypothetical protein
MFFGWGPFPTAPAVGGVFYGPVIEPWIGWSILVVVLTLCCGALWALGEARRPPDDEDAARSREGTKKAA